MEWRSSSIFKQSFSFRSRVTRRSTTEGVKHHGILLPLPLVSGTLIGVSRGHCSPLNPIRSYSQNVIRKELPRSACISYLLESHLKTPLHMRGAQSLKFSSQETAHRLGSLIACHYSSASNQSAPRTRGLPNHKILLHRIIKVVHPDYFSSHPNEQTTNTASLQYLNEWLNEFEKFDLAGGARSTLQRVGRKFHISFFFRPTGVEDTKSRLDLAPTPSDSSTSGVSSCDAGSKLPIVKVTETLYGPVGTLGVREKHRILCSGLIRLMTLMQLDIPEEFRHYNTRRGSSRGSGAEVREPLRERERSPQYKTDNSVNEKEEFIYDAFNENIFDFLSSIPIPNLQAAVITKDQQLMARVDVDLFRNRISEFLGSTGGILMRAFGTRSKDQLNLIHAFLKTLERNFPGLDTRYWNRKLVRQTSVYDANEEATTSFAGSFRHDALQRKLHGISLFIDEGNCRVDDDGSVVLGADDSTDDWLNFLEHHFDPEEAILKQQFRSVIHDLERRAAQILNVSLVIPESEELGSTTKYARFLDSIIDFSPFEAHSAKPTPKTKFLCEQQYQDFYEGVYVVVREPQNAIPHGRSNFNNSSKDGSSRVSGDPDEESTISVHPRFGFIQLDIGESALDIHYFVETTGAYARYLSEKNQKEVKMKNHTLNLIRRRFQLHTVQAANNLTTEQVLECCNRLNECGSELVHWLKGKNLVISDGFKFHENALEIQWDFQM